MRSKVIWFVACPFSRWLPACVNLLCHLYHFGQVDFDCLDMTNSGYKYWFISKLEHLIIIGPCFLRGCCEGLVELYCNSCHGYRSWIRSRSGVMRFTLEMHPNESCFSDASFLVSQPKHGTLKKHVLAWFKDLFMHLIPASSFSECGRRVKQKDFLVIGIARLAYTRWEITQLWTSTLNISHVYRTVQTSTAHICK